MSSDSRPALFLDRDGTLIEEVHFLTRPDQIRILPGAVEALQKASSHGLVNVLVTNQSGVARGYLSEKDLNEIHRILENRLKDQGAPIAAIYACPHHPNEGNAPYRRDCRCRKPKPGLLQTATSDLHLDLGRSCMVGDSLRDIEAGRRAGCRASILVRTGKGGSVEIPEAPSPRRPDDVVSDLAAAVDRFLDGFLG